MKKVIISGLIILFVSNILVFSQNPEDLLPEENEITGWVFDTDSLCLQGTANDSTSLYTIIDGGAELYIDLGFVAGAFDGYTDGSHPICIEIYDQGSPSNAASVYQATNDGEYKPITTAGDSARMDTSLVFNIEIEMIVDKFFVRIFTTDTKEDAYIQAATSMAQNIAGEVGIIENHGLQNISPANHISVSHFRNNYQFIIQGKNLFKEKNKLPEALIYNNKGQMIRRLLLRSVEKGFQAAWDGNNKEGQEVAKGLYTVIIRSDKGLISKCFTKNR